LVRKIWMRATARYDTNYFFHELPHGVPPGELEEISILVGDGDEAIAERIIAAFHRAIADEEGASKSYIDAWDNNHEVYYGELLDLLHSRDSLGLAYYFANMHRRKSTYGISGSVVENRRLKRSSFLRDKELTWMKDILVSLAESLGILPFEAVVPYVEKKNMYIDSDMLAEKISKYMGIEIFLPPVEGGLFKLKFREGFLDYRDMWSLYAAWRINKNIEEGISIAEIGGGLGKVAIYTSRFGFKDYSLFDLPIMNAMTAWHLIKSLPGQAITLYGEPNREDVIRVLPYWLFPQKKYGLVLNQDSFPEIERGVIERYLRDIRKATKYFLSINNEHQAPLFPGSEGRNLVVPEVIEKVGGFKRVYRFPFWLRKGYVEELYEISPQSS